jgi:ribosome recycling factor
MVDGIKAEAYGTKQDLRNIASISVPDSRTIQIEPWDANLVKDIEKAIMESDLGIMPNTAGKVIRLAVPQLTEETRKEYVKALKKRVEDARISVRNVREDVKKEVEANEKAKEITEDERYKLLEELDELVQGFNAQMDALGKEKEAQIMTV